MKDFGTSSPPDPIAAELTASRSPVLPPHFQEIVDRELSRFLKTFVVFLWRESWIPIGYFESHRDGCGRPTSECASMRPTITIGMDAILCCVRPPPLLSYSTRGGTRSHAVESRTIAHNRHRMIRIAIFIGSYKLLSFDVKRPNFLLVGLIGLPMDHCPWPIKPIVASRLRTNLVIPLRPEPVDGTMPLS